MYLSYNLINLQASEPRNFPCHGPIVEPKTRFTNHGIPRANRSQSPHCRLIYRSLSSSRNHLKFGLFSTQNCVRPEETAGFTKVSNALWTDLNSVGPVEEVVAAEIARGA